MKFKKLASLIMVFAICLLLTGCGTKDSKKFSRFEDFYGTTIGVRKGKAHDKYVLSRFEDANIKYYLNNSEMIKAVKKGEIDACVLDSAAADYYDITDSKLAKYPTALNETKYSLCTSDRFDNYDEAYEAIDKWIKDGTIDSLKQKWFSTKQSFMRINNEEYTGYSTYKGKLRVIADKDSIPASYIDNNGVIQGLNVELAYMLAKELNLELEIDTTDDFEYMVESIANNKYDLATGFVITNEDNEDIGDNLQNINDSGVFILVKSNRLIKTKKSKNSIVINSIDDLEGKKVGLLAGSMFENYLIDSGVSTINKFYKTNDETIEAVANGDVVGCVIDKGIAKSSCDKNNKLTYINIDKIEYGFIFPKNDEKLITQFNSYLQKIEMNGTLKILSNTWINETNDSNKILPDYKSLPANNGTLRLATSLSLEPYSYIKANGEYGGFDLEVAIGFCKEYGYGLEIVDGTFDSVLMNVLNSNCDFGGAAIIKTPERQAQFRFSDSTLTGGISLVMLAENSLLANDSQNKTSFGKQIANVFVENENWLVLLKGVGVTLLITFVSAVLGTLLGIILSMEMISGNKKVGQVILQIAKVFRRTPIIVWLAFVAYILYGGRYQYGITIGIMVFTVCFGFDFLESVKKIYWKFTKDDWANGYNLRFNKFISFLFSSFSRYLNDVFTEYKAVLVKLLKNTTLLGLIYSFDFAYACDYVRMNSFVSWLPFLLMFGFYFLTCWFVEYAIDRVKIDFQKEKKSAKDFNFGSVTKFTIEEDGDNVFKLSLKEMNNEASRGLNGPIIKLDNVSVQYENAIGLDEVSVEINKGESIAVAGTNKSGVTTFFNLINGFIEPSVGKATTFGKDVSSNETKKIIRNGVSIVLRKAEMIPYKNVIENIMYVLTYAQNIPKRRAYMQAYKILYKVGLADKAFAYENELTMSEIKRVLLARALVYSPEIVVLDHIDEGLSQYDLVGLSIIISQIKESGTTVLIASDDLDWLKQLTTRMLFFDEGKIVDDGPTDVLINNPEKQKTIEYVSKSTSFNAHIKGKMFDHIEIASKVWTFGQNNSFDYDFVMRISNIINLIETEVIIKVMPSSFNLNMKMVYMKALNSVKLTIEYDGNDFDYINSMAVDKYDIFARLVDSIHYTYDGLNKYEITIPLEKRYN